MHIFRIKHKTLFYCLYNNQRRKIARGQSHEQVIQSDLYGYSKAHSFSARTSASSSGV